MATEPGDPRAEQRECRGAVGSSGRWGALGPGTPQPEPGLHDAAARAAPSSWRGTTLKVAQEEARDGAETPRPTAAARVSGDIAGRRRPRPEPRAPGRRPPDSAGGCSGHSPPRPSSDLAPRGKLRLAGGERCQSMSPSQCLSSRGSVCLSCRSGHTHPALISLTPVLKGPCVVL